MEKHGMINAENTPPEDQGTVEKAAQSDKPCSLRHLAAHPTKRMADAIAKYCSPSRCNEDDAGCCG